MKINKHKRTESLIRFLCKIKWLIKNSTTDFYEVEMRFLEELFEKLRMIFFEIGEIRSL